MIALQLDFFEAATRGDDPETSREAIESITRSGNRATQCEHVLALVRRYGGATGGEIAAASDLDFVQVMRRLGDLKAQRRVRHSGKRRCSVRHRNLTTWDLVH